MATKLVHIRLEEELLERLDARAKYRHMTRSDVIRLILRREARHIVIHAHAVTTTMSDATRLEVVA